jgi:hypothetical protein
MAASICDDPGCLLTEFAVLIVLGLADYAVYAFIDDAYNLMLVQVILLLFLFRVLHESISISLE